MRITSLIWVTAVALTPFAVFSEQIELRGELQQGAQYVLQQDDAVSSGISVKVTASVGWNNEEWYERGCALLLQRMIGKGEVSDDTTTYSFAFDSNNIDGARDAVKLISRRILYIDLSAQNIKREREALLAELLDVVDGLRTLYGVEGVFSDAPGALTMLIVLDQIQPAEVQAFYHKYYRPEHLIIEVFGSVDPAIEAEIIKRFDRPHSPNQTRIAQTLWKWEKRPNGESGIKNNHRGWGVAGRHKPGAPTSELVRVLTGDVRPEWLNGLGRGNYTNGAFTAAAGYDDVFVSSLDEYRKLGIEFQFDGFNDPNEMARKLALAEGDVAKIEAHGAWVLVLNPGRPCATPTGRQNEWNPHYVEGGETAVGIQEWVTPNTDVHSELNAGQMRLFKVQVDGNTVEYKSWRGKLMTAAEKELAIEEAVQAVVRT